MLICLNSETLLLGMHSFVIVTHVRIRHWKEDSHCYTVQAAKVETQGQLVKLGLVWPQMQYNAADKDWRQLFLFLHETPSKIHC